MKKSEVARALRAAPDAGPHPFLAGYTLEVSRHRGRYRVYPYYILRDVSGVTRFTNTDADTLADVFVRMYAQWEA